MIELCLQPDASRGQNLFDVKGALWRVGRCERRSDSLALGAVAVHAVLYGLVAGLADGAAGHLHSQPGLRAPLDGSLQPSALRVYCRETHRHSPNPQRSTALLRQTLTVNIWSSW